MRRNQNQYGQWQGPRQQGRGWVGQDPHVQIPIPYQPQVRQANLPPPVNIHRPAPVNMGNEAPRRGHMGAGQAHWNQQANINLQNRGRGRYAANLNNLHPPAQRQNGNLNVGFVQRKSAPFQMRNPVEPRGNYQIFHPYQQNQINTERKYDPEMSLEEAMSTN